MALFPEGREVSALDCEGVRVQVHCDLTSTYFESDPPFEDNRQFGYSREWRCDIYVITQAAAFPALAKAIGRVVAYEFFELHSHVSILGDRSNPSEFPFPNISLESASWSRRISRSLLPD